MIKGSLDIIVGSSIFSLLLAGSCTSNFATKDHYIEKEKIAENFEIDFIKCPDREQRENRSYLSEFIFLSNQTEQATSDSFSRFAQNYAKEVSYRPENSVIKSWVCWYGDEYGQAKIGHLKDPNKSWVWLAQPLNGTDDILTAHQCAFSNTPGKITNDACPPIKEVK